MKTKAIVLAATLALSVSLFAGCNTLRGAERDIENVGDSVARGIHKAGDAVTHDTEDMRDSVMFDRYHTTDRTLGNMNRINDYGKGINEFGDNALMPNTSLAHSGSMGVNHLVSLMGMTANDSNMALGKGRMLSTGNGSSFTHNIYGGDTDIDVVYDDDNNIHQMKVYVDNAHLARWQRELNTRYGTPADASNVMWQADNSVIRMNPGTDRTEFVLSRSGM